MSSIISQSSDVLIKDAHSAAAAGDLESLLQLYLEEVDLQAMDEKGNTPLHIAAMRDQRSAARGLMTLGMPEITWLVKNKEGKTPMELATPHIRKDMQLISMKNAIVSNQHNEYNKKLVEQRLANPNKNYKVLLSVDGGGIKAILVMGTMLALERELREPLMDRIHWLGGTSCGGIISLVLGSGYTCESVRKLFLREKMVTFCGNTKAFPKHNSVGIESTLKKYLGDHTKMAELKAHKVLVTTAKVKSAPPTLLLFRTYAPRISAGEAERYGYLNPKEILVWKAARSTSAAPTYFSSFHGMADGAIFCNNPSLTLMTEFFRLKKLENYKGITNVDEVGAVISLGSGTEPVLPLQGIDIELNTKYSINKYYTAFGSFKNLITLFLYQCTSSHAVSAGQAREWAHSNGIPFFRLCPKLTKAVELDCTNLVEIFNFCFENEVYLRTQARREIEDLVRLLKSMPKNEIRMTSHAAKVEEEMSSKKSTRCKKKK